MGGHPGRNVPALMETPLCVSTDTESPKVRPIPAETHRIRCYQASAARGRARSGPAACLDAGIEQRADRVLAQTRLSASETWSSSLKEAEGTTNAK